MKTLVSLFVTLFFVLSINVATVEEAHAKKFGSGGFGKSFTTSPFKKNSPSAAPKDQKQGQMANKPRSGMMGGLMGGLLAGGIFAYLLGSGAFEGLQIMDMLLFALIGFVLFKLFKGSRQSAYAANGAGAHGASAPQAYQQHFQSLNVQSSAQDEVPFVMPAGFDVAGFEQGALEHYRLVSQAWDYADFATLAEYVSPEYMAQLKAEREQLAAQLENQILDLSAQLVRGETIENGHRLSVLFRGRLRDAQTAQESGIFDVWHLEKTVNSTWLIVGIEAE